MPSGANTHIYTYTNVCWQNDFKRPDAPAATPGLMNENVKYPHKYQYGTNSMSLTFYQQISVSHQTHVNLKLFALKPYQSKFSITVYALTQIMKAKCS